MAVALVVAGCGSGSGPGSGATVPDKPTTTSTTTEKTTTTTGREPASTTTTGRVPATTPTTAQTTTTTGNGPTTTTTAPATTTTAPATTTTAPATTSTTAKATTTTTEATTTTAAPTNTTTLAADTIRSDSSDMPWIALGALAALALLVLVFALRSRSKRAEWWTRADALVHDGRSVVDLGTAGPAGADPQQEIAHWGTIEQRAQAFANEISAVAADDVPDDATRATLGGLGQSVGDYLTALRTSRTLRIGPPAPTPGQLQYADAESTQRLAIVRATLDQLDQLIAPHRKTA